MKLTGGLFLSQLESTGFFVISQPEPFVELLFDVAISALFVDIRKAGFINFESFIAMGKNNAVYALFYCLNCTRLDYSVSFLFVFKEAQFRTYFLKCVITAIKA